MTENTTEVEETFEPNAEGVAYTSESDASADAPARPATIGVGWRRIAQQWRACISVASRVRLIWPARCGG